MAGGVLGLICVSDGRGGMRPDDVLGVGGGLGPDVVLGGGGGAPDSCCT